MVRASQGTLAVHNRRCAVEYNYVCVISEVVLFCVVVYFVYKFIASKVSK